MENNNTNKPEVNGEEKKKKPGKQLKQRANRAILLPAAHQHLLVHPSAD